MRSAIAVAAGALMLLLTVACELVETDKEQPGMAEAEGVRRGDREGLSQRRIFFGHQSVGSNILQGLKESATGSSGSPLEVLEVPEGADPPAAGLIHRRLGKNGDPASKIEAFAEAIEGGMGTWAEIALVKFCFWDIRQQTDVKAVLEAYDRNFDVLREKYPGMTFVHVTVPLMSTQRGWRTGVKRLFGMATDWELDNVRRGEYNALLRQEYEGREPIYDIARIESTLPDGGRELFSYAGKRYEALACTYTSDGGHLNELGRQQAARGLLAVLASIPKP